MVGMENGRMTIWGWQYKPEQQVAVLGDCREWRVSE